jgi:hypothetical protein
LRLLSRVGIACDVVAPSLVPVRAGDRVKTDRRDAKKLVRLYRAGELRFVAPPSPEHEGLRDLVRCRDDVRRARTAARHRVAKQLLRHGRVAREGEKARTQRHIAWVRAQRVEHPLAQCALEHARAHLASLDARLARSTASLRGSPAASRGPTRCADSARSAASPTAPRSGCWPRSATGTGSATRASWPPTSGPCRASTPPATSATAATSPAPATGTPAACSSSPPGTTSTGPPPLTTCPRRSPPAPGAPSCACTTATAPSPPGKRSTVATVAIARELAAFLWAAMTHQPLRIDEDVAAA